MLVTYEALLDSFEGDPGDVPRGLVERRLAEAERLLFRQCPASRRLADSDPEVRAFVEDVIIRAVLRTVRDSSPGLKSEQLGNYGYTKDSLSSSGNLWFPREDLAGLPCSAGSRVGVARTSPDPTFANTRPRVVRGGGWW